MTARLALFDCDGTLVDSQANICTAMEQAFVAFDLPPPDRHDIRRIVGLSLHEAIRHVAPFADEAQHLALVERYKGNFQALRHAGQIAEPLYDGLREVLDRLRDDGWMLGVATGKSDRGLLHCLDSHGLLDHFVTLQTADRHPSKPHPSMIEHAMAEAGAAVESTVMIGDTSFDMAMGVNAGVRALGVDWGYHTPEELIAAGAETVVTDMEQLWNCLNGTSE